MGLPEVAIEFQEKRSNFIHRLGRGMVAIPFVDAAFTTSGVVSVSDTSAIETAVGSLPEAQKALVGEELKRALTNGASKAIAVCAKDATTAENMLSAQRFNHLALGNLTDDDQTAVHSWAAGKKYACGRNFLVYGAASLLDDAGEGHVIAVDDTNLTDAETTTAAIAGVFAGLSERSGTYYVMNSKTDGTGFATRDQADTAVDAGILTVFFDGEKAKISRAVTTYYAEDPKSAFGKIRNVDAMNMMIDDINDAFQNQYIGKVLNSYDNKMAFIGLINQSYLKGLENDVLDPDGTNKVDIDVEMHKELAKAAGETVDEMTEMDLRKYNTGSAVYLTGTVRFLDTMEDLKIIFVIS